MEMFKNLIVWQKAMELVRAVYALSKAFPADERYALTDQLRRAVVSIPSNIAEGNGRASNAEYGHFLSIARGSLYETMTQLQIAVDLGYIPALDPTLEALISEVGRMLTSMLKKFGSLRCTPTPSTYTESNYDRHIRHNPHRTGEDTPQAVCRETGPAQSNDVLIESNGLV